MLRFYFFSILQPELLSSDRNTVEIPVLKIIKNINNFLKEQDVKEYTEKEFELLITCVLTVPLKILNKGKDNESEFISFTVKNVQAFHNNLSYLTFTNLEKDHLDFIQDKRNKNGFGKLIKAYKDENDDD